MTQQAATYASKPVFESSKLSPSLLRSSPPTPYLTPSALHRSVTAATTPPQPSPAAAQATKQGGPGSAETPRFAGGHATDVGLPMLVHGGAGTVPYDTQPSRKKYSALWEYETYRKFPDPDPNVVHEEYAKYLHPHKYPFLHMDPTPWPSFNAYQMSGLFFGLYLWFHFSQPDLLIVSFIGTCYGWGMWWRDIVREGLLEGKHTIGVKNAMRFAFVLFIVSEVMFFFTFFWGYYHNVSNPIWLIMPPEMIIKGWGVPMLNTAILLSSGAAVTWAHHATICAKDIMKKAPK